MSDHWWTWRIGRLAWSPLPLEAVYTAEGAWRPILTRDPEEYGGRLLWFTSKTEAA